MNKEEAYSYFDEHWTDYNAIHSLLDKIFDHYERQIAILNSQPSVTNDCSSENSEIERLKNLLKKCQDQLDEETHQLKRYLQDNENSTKV